MKRSLTYSLSFGLVSLAVAAGCESGPELVTASSSDDDSGEREAELDADGDGVADVLGVAVDKDGDGVPDDFDLLGDGSAVGPGVDTDGDGEADAIGLDLDDDGIIDALDLDGDGEADVFADGGGGVTDIVVEGLGGSGSTTPKGNGEPEICDGKDNDADGFIDNVDEGGDGICDCLNIGTIGRIGPWSSGGDIFKDWLDTRSPIPATALEDSELTEEVLQGLDVIVVLRADTAALSRDSSPAHHEFVSSEVNALESWVRGGGGLMTTIGYQADEVAEMENVNRLLNPFSLGYDPTEVGLDGLLENWDADHPVALGITSINTVNGVSPLGANGTVVASDPDGRTGVIAEQADDGRIIVFGDEWVTYDSEWEDTDGQQVELLWLNMIKWMSPPERCQVEIPPQLVR